MAVTTYCNSKQIKEMRSLHLLKDRWWDEDKHYLKRPGLGETFAVLRNAALSVLKWGQK